jgi:hypothetical protein
MTRTAAARHDTATHDTAKHETATHGRTTRPVIPAPRRSPEQQPEPGPEPDAADESYGYPLVRYAMEHATALHPDGR